MPCVEKTRGEVELEFEKRVDEHPFFGALQAKTRVCSRPQNAKAADDAELSPAYQKRNRKTDPPCFFFFSFLRCSGGEGRRSVHEAVRSELSEDARRERRKTPTRDDKQQSTNAKGLKDVKGGK